MDFDANRRARARTASSASTPASDGRRRDAFGKDALLRESRELRASRARERARDGAARTIQGAYRRAVRRMEAVEADVRSVDRAFERLTTMGTNGEEDAEDDDASLETVVTTMTTRGVRALGPERTFKVLALALKRARRVREMFDEDVVGRLCVEACEAVKDEDGRARLPALAVCASKLVATLCDLSDDAFVRGVHGDVCDALAAAMDCKHLPSEHRAAAAAKLVPVTLRPLSGGEENAENFQQLARKIISVPKLRLVFPPSALETLEEPKTLARILSALVDDVGIKVDAKTIENVMDLLQRGSSKGKGLRMFASGDEQHGIVALRALTSLCARARAQKSDWYSAVMNEAVFRTSATGALSESWFLTALVEGDDGVMRPNIAAEAALLYIELALASNSGVYSACAFARGYLKSLWTHLAQTLALSDEVREKDAPTSWVAPTFKRNGILDVPKGLVGCFGFFCALYDHLLVILRDDQFYGAEGPFTLDEQRAIAIAVNTVVVRSYVSNQVHLITEEMRRTVENAANLLHALTTRDARRKFCPDGMWLAPNDLDLVPEVAASALRTYIQSNVSTQISELLVSCPHSVSFDERVRIFRELIRADRAKSGYRAQAGGADAVHRDSFVRPVAQLIVRRQSVLEDALGFLLPLGAKAKGRLLVKFVNEAGQEEAGIDAGGLFKELLAQVTEQGLDPNRGLFTTNAKGLIHPSARAGDTHEGLLLLEMIGMMVGKGLYEGILQDINLAPFFAATILGTPRTIDDIPSLDEELHRSIVQILEYDGDVADLCLDFTCDEEVYGQLITRELMPGGRDVDVKASNKLLYVHLLADYHLNKRLAVPVHAFMKGMQQMIDKRWLRLFNVQELSLLLSGGESAIDVDDWQKYTHYSGGYTSSSAPVKNFWKVMRKLNAQQRSDVLKFVTSSPRPPLQGFKHLNPPFVIHKVSESASIFAALGAGKDVQRLPSASTCFNILKLPNYRRLSSLERSIIYASQSKAGFELS
jgi:hypothetical protein